MSYESLTNGIARLADAWAELMMDLAEQSEIERREIYEQMKAIQWDPAIVKCLEEDVMEFLAEKEKEDEEDAKEEASRRKRAD